MVMERWWEVERRWEEGRRRLAEQRREDQRRVVEQRRVEEQQRQLRVLEYRRTAQSEWDVVRRQTEAAEQKRRQQNMSEIS